MKRETKIYSQEPQTQSEGSFWELCVFAIFFVVIFTALARTAHAAPLSKSQRSRAVRIAKNDPNLQAQSSPASTASPANDDSSVSPIRAQSIPSAIPTGALPRANMAAGLPEKDSNKRFVFASSLIIDTSTGINTDDQASFTGEYLMKTGMTDQKHSLAYLLKFGYDREYSYELADGRDGDFVDPSIAITKTWKEGKEFRSPVFSSIVAGVSGVAGASRESARRTFVGSVGPSIAVTKDIHKLSLGQKFGYQRKFYNYDIRDDGTVNAPDSFSSVSDISYNFSESLSVSAQAALFYAISFQGSGDTLEWSTLSLDWSITKALGTSVGIATKRGTISDDGTYNQVKFVDVAATQAFFDLILNF